MLTVCLRSSSQLTNHELAHSILRECLKRYGVNYCEAMASRGEHGKPFLADFLHIHYNLTHSKGIVACLVSDRECGVDAEKIRPYRPNVVKRAFSDRERDELEKLPPQLRDEYFFRLWTLKEAYIKAIGVGLSFPLKEAEFSIENNSIRTNILGWNFKQYIIKEQFILSTAVRD